MSTPTATSAPRPGDDALDRLLGPRAAAPPPAGALAASATFGWRAMLKIRHEPEQLVDVIAIPVLFTLLFTYLFGGALGGSPSRYLSFLLPGTLVHGRAAHHHVRRASLNTDVDQRRLRPVPVHAHLARRLSLGGLLGDVGRYLLARPSWSSSAWSWATGPTAACRACSPRWRWSSSSRSALSWLWTAVGLLAAHPAVGHERQLRRAVPADVRQQRLRRTRDDARLAAGLRQRQPGQPPGHRRAGLMSGTAGRGQVGWVLLASAALIAVFGSSPRLYRQPR